MPIPIGDRLHPPHVTSNDHQQGGSEDDPSHDGSKVRRLLDHVQSAVLPKRITFSKPSKPDTQYTPYTPLNKVTVVQPTTSNGSSAQKEKQEVNEDGFQEPNKLLFPKARVNGIIRGIISHHPSHLNIFF